MKVNSLWELIGFVLWIISQFKKFQLKTRLIAILLIITLLMPAFLFNSTSETKAQTNLSLKQTAPMTAPPEPYITSSATSPANVLPFLTAIGSAVSSNYSTMAAFITGPVTPEGLGAATPPPTITERFSRFFIPLLIASGANITETNETKERASNESSSIAPLLPSCTPRTAFDFDGDCQADVGRWQANSFQYKVYNSGSNTYTTLNLGSSGSKIAPADFDGDGRFDMAVFSAGSWTVRKSTNNSNWSVTWGTTGDLPAAADYDGDGTADFAIYRPSTNTFWVLTSGSGYTSYTSTVLGSSGDMVVPGDFDGDNKADCAVFRPSNGHWYHLPSSGGGVVDVAWGVASDIPSPGDFDNDGKTDRTIFRPSTGTWYVHKSSGGSPNYFEVLWGNLGDQPVPADYDGDGISDISIYRPTTGAWWILTSGSDFKDSMTLTLGTGADKAVPSAYLKQTGAELYPDYLSPARLAPINATGGTNYYSRNAAWSTGLVNLPGRSGMNLNIGMGYNSLVWTKVGSTMAFDMDKSNLAPGFNFGFPRIESAYISSQTSLLSYLMVSPSGARTEFRQTAAGDTYETADSSYAQVKVNNPGSANNPTPIEDITLTVTGVGGTQMSYSWIGNAYHCTQIKDRNGNFITISNNSYGELTSVTDTLGRVVTVNYDGYNRVSSITQNWQSSNGSGSNTTHTWASFDYTTKTISTSFDTSLAVYGPANNASISVLDKVTFADGSYTKFDYNGYAQVYKISNYAYNNDFLNDTWRNIETPASNQPDCPRFTQTKTKVANFNGGNEVTVNNTFSVGQTYTPPDSSSVTGTKIEIKTPDSTGTADALVTKIYSPSSGWAEALPVLTEDFATESSTLTKKRWSWANYTQEDTGLAYLKNPRVTETKVGDDSNTKRTKIYYLMQPNSSTLTQYGLVNAVEVYDTNQSTVLKTQTKSYNLSSNYVSRKIIGLPSETNLYEGTTSGTLVSKVTYDYDESGYAGTGQSVTATQHDNTNFGTAFSYRGNLTSTKRWNAASPSNSSLISNSQVKYNIAGSPISQTDPVGRTSTISYTDIWNDTVSRNAAYAYPTTLTDSGGYSSTIKYRFDIGANVWARSPLPSGTNNSYGKTLSKTYDDTTGRITKEKIDNSISEAYTRYVYPNDGASLNTYTTIVDVNNDNAMNSTDEVLTETLLDGAGRVRKTRTEKPGGSSYVGKITEYNILGQVKRGTVLTEINSSWTPAGDDYRLDSQNNVTFLWIQTEYDWKGRVTRTVNTDGTDTLTSYEGCGCAGGEIVTVQSEELTEGRKTQKHYSDILGRNKKTEILDWNQSVYKTITNSYNGLDQVTSNRVYSGADTSNTYQETTNSYDGHGRLSAQHLPEQDTNKSTIYTYFADDKPETITDGRGAAKSYTYNNRGLISEINWSVPQNSTIEVPSEVTFSYDNAGNRTEMTDGLGSLTYEYDELSRLKAETRQFNETVATAPLSNNRFKIDYTYGRGGQLATLTEPYGEVVSYGYNKTGQLKTVSGNRVSESVQLNYVTDAQYRAWGAIKRLDYGNNTYVGMNYGNRLQAQDYTLAHTGSSTMLYQSYQYYDDGRLKFSSPSTNSIFDRSYEYDFLGRLTAAKTGNEARGQTENTPANRPYRAVLEYNAFGNIVGQDRLHWTAGFDTTFQYQNGKITSEETSRNVPGWESYVEQTGYSFDEDGRRTEDGKEYDADGRVVSYNQASDTGEIRWYDQQMSYSGDNNITKSVRLAAVYCHSVSQSPLPYHCGNIERKKFRISSSVVKEVVAEIDVDKNTYPNNNTIDYSYNRRIYTHAAGKEIAERRIIYAGTSFKTDKTLLKTADASGVDKVEMQLRNDGTGNQFSAEDVTSDPFGASTGFYNPYPPPRQSGPPDPNDPDCKYHDYDEWECAYADDYVDPENEDSQAGSVSEKTCYQEGIEVDCNYALSHSQSFPSDDAELAGEEGGKHGGDAPPSEEGPVAVHQDDDSSDDGGEDAESEVREFEVAYTSEMDATFKDDISVTITDTSFRKISTWDFRSQTLDLVGGTSGERLLFKQAHDKAKELFKNEKCKEALGGDKALKLLDKARYSVSPALSKDKEDSESYKELKYLALSRQSNSIVFDREYSFLSGKTKYEFFDDFALTYYVKPKNNVELGAYTILEGIGGLTTAVYGVGTAEYGRDRRRENAQIILKNCFGDNTPPEVPEETVEDDN